jgi:hypothetical protein
MIKEKALTDRTTIEDDEETCGVNIAGAIDGVNWVEGCREWNVERKLV